MTQASRPVTILVVDDDPLLLRMTEIVLDGLGYRVLLASSGRHALDRVEQEQGSLDLMVLDLRMPDMDGMTVLREARKRHPGLRVLLVTGYASDNVLQTLQEVGAVGVLEKPYDVDTFAEAVQKALPVDTCP